MGNMCLGLAPHLVQANEEKNVIKKKAKKRAIKHPPAESLHREHTKHFCSHFEIIHNLIKLNPKKEERKGFGK